MDGWVGGWLDRLAGCMGGFVYVCMYVYMGGCVYVWLVRWMYGCMNNKRKRKGKHMIPVKVELTRRYP